MLWQSEGLTTPECVQAATEEYRAENDVLADFLAECVETDTAGNVRAGEAFVAYQKWADERRYPNKARLGPVTFGSLMAKRFERKKESGGRYLHGIRLAAEP